MGNLGGGNDCLSGAYRLRADEGLVFMELPPASSPWGGPWSLEDSFLLFQPACLLLAAMPAGLYRKHVGYKRGWRGWESPLESS